MVDATEWGRCACLRRSRHKSAEELGYGSIWRSTVECTGSGTPALRALAGNRFSTTSELVCRGTSYGKKSACGLLQLDRMMDNGYLHDPGKHYRGYYGDRCYKRAYESLISGERFAELAFSGASSQSFMTGQPCAFRRVRTLKIFTIARY
jgi:hypothetical protein